jgi:predicted heme/steroid binding protein
MSQSIVPEQTWESMTEAEKAQAVRQGQATLEQMRQGVLDGPDDLRRACWEVLAHRSVEKTTLEFTESLQTERPDTVAQPKKRQNGTGILAGKQRFGLPKGFVPRTQRAQTNILLPRNVYRMPNGVEVVPCEPTGTLGRLHHLYALLTLEQYENGARGSIYVRADGRVFDYSVDDVASGREMFDTGLTVSDLERTGSYVNTLESKRASVGKLKRAAHVD